MGHPDVGFMTHQSLTSGPGFRITVGTFPGPLDHVKGTWGEAKTYLQNMALSVLMTLTATCQMTRFL